MFKYLVFILFIASFIFLNLTCHICKLAEDQRLSNIQKQQNPFKGYEKIIYKAGDSTFEFAGTGRRNWTEKYGWDDDNCDWGLIEFDNLSLSGHQFEIYLNIRESKYYYLSLTDSINDIYLYSKLVIDKAHGSISNYNEFFNELNVNDITYSAIYKDTLIQPNVAPDIPDSIKYATFLYYSSDYGIVKFDFSDGSAWELKEIVW